MPNSCGLSSLLSASDDELSLEASVYVFSFSFSEESKVEMSAIYLKPANSSQQKAPVGKNIRSARRPCIRDIEH